MSSLAMSVVSRSRTINGRIVVNAALLFIPVAIIGEHYGMGGVFVFVCAALS